MAVSRADRLAVVAVAARRPRQGAVAGRVWVPAGVGQAVQRRRSGASRANPRKTKVCMCVLWVSSFFLYPTWCLLTYHPPKVSLQRTREQRCLYRKNANEKRELSDFHHSVCGADIQASTVPDALWIAFVSLSLSLEGVSGKVSLQSSASVVLCILRLLFTRVRRVECPQQSKGGREREYTHVSITVPLSSPLFFALSTSTPHQHAYVTAHHTHSTHTSHTNTQTYSTLADDWLWWSNAL